MSLYLRSAETETVIRDARDAGYPLLAVDAVASRRDLLVVRDAEAHRRGIPWVEL